MCVRCQGEQRALRHVQQSSSFQDRVVVYLVARALARDRIVDVYVWERFEFSLSSLSYADTIAFERSSHQGASQAGRL